MEDYTSEELTRSKTENRLGMTMKQDYTSEELTRSKTAVDKRSSLFYGLHLGRIDEV